MEEMVQEAFLDVLCDLIYGNGWMDLERVEEHRVRLGAGECIFLLSIFSVASIASDYLRWSSNHCLAHESQPAALPALILVLPFHSSCSKSLCRWNTGSNLRRALPVAAYFPPFFLNLE